MAVFGHVKDVTSGESVVNEQVHGLLRTVGQMLLLYVGH